MRTESFRTCGQIFLTNLYLLKSKMMEPIRVQWELKMRSLTMNNLAIQQRTAQTEQREQEENSRTLLRRLREVREREADDERARQEHVRRRLGRVA